jgi:hypothetical protein
MSLYWLDDPLAWFVSPQGLTNHAIAARLVVSEKPGRWPPRSSPATPVWCAKTDDRYASGRRAGGTDPPPGVQVYGKCELMKMLRSVAICE